MSEPTLNDAMKAYADSAVEYVQRNFGFALDYSIGSIDQVEVVADKVFKSKPRGFRKLLNRGPANEEIDALCKMLGGYLGEIYRTQKGGDWALNTEFSAIGIQRGSSWIFPPAKVHKRLTYGAEDSLSYYFKVALEEPWEKNAS